MTITQLTIYTSQLQEQTEYYQNILGLTLLNKSDNSAEFKVGYTTLTFIKKSSATPYHFAINIPANKENEALQWLKQRVKILTDDSHELIDFKSWNAKSIYFYDADNNIVELIARKNLKTETEESFNQHQFLGVSEIGLSVLDIEDTYQAINAITEVTIYDGSFDRFCAVGDELGLFIIIDQNKKHWFPTNDFAHTSDFKISGDVNLEFKNGEIKEPKDLRNQKESS